MVQAVPHGYGSEDGWTSTTHIDVANRAAAPERPPVITYPPGVPAPNAAPAAGGVRATRTAARADRREQGLPSWAALLVLLAIAGLGAFVDSLGGSSLKGGFNVGLVVGSAVAILIVKRRGMFPIVIAPPIVFAFASAADLYLHLHGATNRHALLIAAAENWLVYGFPAIAGATAAVLIVAGIRLVIGR